MYHVMNRKVLSLILFRLKSMPFPFFYYSHCDVMNRKVFVSLIIFRLNEKPMNYFLNSVYAHFYFTFYESSRYIFPLLLDFLYYFYLFCTWLLLSKRILILFLTYELWRILCVLCIVLIILPSVFQKCLEFGLW